MQSVIALPWCLKIFYGLVADNLPIFGSNRRAYLIVNSLTQAVVMFLLSYHFLEYADKGAMNATWVTLLLTIAAMNSAWYNVVVNALMVA